jgi:hypothetical protein
MKLRCINRFLSFLILFGKILAIIMQIIATLVLISKPYSPTEAWPVEQQQLDKFHLLWAWRYSYLHRR